MHLSIVIPSRNTPSELLRRAVLSAVAAANGTLGHEIVVVDDHSDPPIDLPSLMREEFPTNRVRCVRAPRWVGIAGARNLGAQVAQGNFLTFLDSDDVLKEGSLDPLLEAASPSRVVFADHEVFEPGLETRYVRRKQRWIRLLEDFRKRLENPFFFGNFIVLPVVIPRRLFDEVGGYPSAGYAGEHVGLYAALAARPEVQFVHVPGALYEYRPRRGGYSHSNWISHHADKGHELSRALVRAGFGPAHYSGIYLTCPAEPTLYLPVVAGVLRVPSWAEVDLPARGWRPRP